MCKKIFSVWVLFVLTYLVTRFIACLWFLPMDWDRSFVVNVVAVIAAISTLCITIHAVRENTKAVISANHLKLREMFNEKKKWKVHKVLAMRFARDASVATNEKPRKRADPGISENSDSPTIDGLKETSLDEYLGLFEIAYMLIKNNNLDKMLFFKTYSYRINYLAKDPAIIKKLVKEAGMWANLNALIAMNEKWLRK